MYKLHALASVLIGLNLLAIDLPAKVLCETKRYGRYVNTAIIYRKYNFTYLHLHSIHYLYRHHDRVTVSLPFIPIFS